MMNENKYVNIVITGDENYVMPMGVTMFSIVRNLSKDKIARFFLFVSGWSDAQESEIRKLKNCEIIIIHMEKYLHYFSFADTSKFKLEYIHSLAPYYRLLIPKILPSDIDKVFYIDADMIVDADISEIYDIPSNKLMAAVVELVANSHDYILTHLKDWTEFEKFNTNRHDAPYFNAGFFLMNLKLAREINIFQDFMDFLAQHPNPPYCDQDTLNATCGQKYSDKMVYLPPWWNTFCDMNYDATIYSAAYYPRWQVNEAFQNPRILHYAGPNKPWVNSYMPHHLFIWHKYFELSPFADTKLNLKPDIEWLSLFFIPIIQINYIVQKLHMRIKFLGIFELYSRFFSRHKIYFFGIPLLKMIWSPQKRFIYLFHFIPLLQIRKKK